MVNPKALASLTDHIGKWIEASCDQDWWTRTAGYMTDGTAERLAFLVLTAMDEARRSAEHAEVVWRDAVSVTASSTSTQSMNWPT